MATKAKSNTVATAPATTVQTPAVDPALLAAVMAALQAQAAPAAPAAPKGVAKAAALPVIDFSVLRAISPLKQSESGKTMGCAVRGKLADGTTIGGNIWIKL